MRDCGPAALFRVITDASVRDDGWYIDDVEITGGTGYRSSPVVTGIRSFLTKTEDRSLGKPERQQADIRLHRGDALLCYGTLRQNPYLFR